MWRILDEELLAGVSAAELHLRPARHARLLDADDYEAACAEVELVCQLWGGMADLLVPVNGDGTPDPYPTLLRHADVDAAIGRNASQLVPGLSRSFRDGFTVPMLHVCEQRKRLTRNNFRAQSPQTPAPNRPQPDIPMQFEGPGGTNVPVPRACRSPARTDTQMLSELRTETHASCLWP